MRRYLFVSATFALLSGCVPVSVYHKTGGNLAQLQNDEVTCQVQALQKVPVNRMTRITPIRTLPREVCNSKGHCRIVYMEFGGEVETYDANLPLRQKVETQCMINKGYQQIDIPICNTRPATLPGTMPALNAKTCAVKTKAGYRATTPG